MSITTFSTDVSFSEEDLQWLIQALSERLADLSADICKLCYSLEYAIQNSPYFDNEINRTRSFLSSAEEARARYGMLREMLLYKLENLRKLRGENKHAKTECDPD